MSESTKVSLTRNINVVKSFTSDYGIIFLLVFLFATAFILSFDALNQLSSTNGISNKLFGVLPLSMLWPLSLDAMIIASSIVEYTGAKRGYGDDFVKSASKWVMIFTVLSVGFNLLEAITTQGNELIELANQAVIGNIDTALVISTISALVGSVLVRIVPPLGMYISFEKLLMRMVHAQMKKERVVKTIAELESEAEAKRTGIETEVQRYTKDKKTLFEQLEQQRITLVESLSGLDAELQKRQAELSGLNTRIEAKRAEVKAIGKVATVSKKKTVSVRDSKKLDRQEKVFKLWKGGERVQSRISAMVSSTPKTVSKDLKELGLIDKDGKEITCEDTNSKKIIELVGLSSVNTNGNGAEAAINGNGHGLSDK